MNLMFWKKKTTAEDSADNSQDKLDNRPVSRNAPGRESRDQKTLEDTQGETSNTSSAHPKRGLIMGTAIGVLTLAVIGLTSWKFFLPSPKPDPVTAGTPTAIQPVPLPGKQMIKLPPIEFPQLRSIPAKEHQTDIDVLIKRNDALQTQIEELKVVAPQIENSQSAIRQAEIETLKKKNDELQTQIVTLKAELPQLEKVQVDQHQANIDALTKKNNELQAQIEALRKQQHLALPSNQTTGKTPPSSGNGNVAIGTLNPKANAKTLKKIIEEMNDDSGDPPNKSAK